MKFETLQKVQRSCKRIQEVPLGTRSVERQHGAESSAVHHPDETARDSRIVAEELYLG